MILAPEGRIFVTGPDVVRSVTGEDVDMLRLGGPDTHERKSGVVHVVADDEADALNKGRAIATLLAAQGGVAAEVPDVDLASLLPESPKRAYDVHPLIDGLLDEGSVFELHARWAPNVTTAFGRLGRPDGRRRRQQPTAAGGLPGFVERREGRPLRPDLRRLRCSAGRAR